MSRGPSVRADGLARLASLLAEELVPQFQVPLHTKLSAELVEGSGDSPDAGILVFHGEVNRPDALIGKRNRWGRGLRPAPWIEEHWRA